MQGLHVVMRSCHSDLCPVAVAGTGFRRHSPSQRQSAHFGHSRLSIRPCCVLAAPTRHMLRMHNLSAGPSRLPLHRCLLHHIPGGCHRHHRRRHHRHHHLLPLDPDLPGPEPPPSAWTRTVVRTACAGTWGAACEWWVLTAPDRSLYCMWQHVELLRSLAGLDCSRTHEI